MGILDYILPGATAALRRRRWLQAARKGKALRPSEVTPGPCLVTGEARPIESLVRAPFTQRECAFWLARLDAKVWVATNRRALEDGNEVLQWREQFRVASTVPFDVVGPDGGVVRVEASSVTYDVPLEAVSSEDPHLNDDNPYFDAFLRQNGVVPTAYMGIAGDTRFFERRTPAGAPVTLYGRVETTSSVRADGYRDAPSSALRLVGTEEEPIVILRA